MKDFRTKLNDGIIGIFSKTEDAAMIEAITEKSRTHVGFKDDFRPFRRYFFL